NLLANPIVTLQFGGRQIAARATPVTDVQEIARAVYRFRKNSPFYAELLARISSAEEINLGTLVDISGEFTVVRFDPLQSEPALKGIEASRWWVTSIAIMGIALASIGWLWKRRHH
ncbi:MAG: hypothetical protein KDE09_24385, partial [Anaerolineales bacterium]|nr:hypothetical protein [Anaerolineales bacterium]